MLSEKEMQEVDALALEHAEIQREIEEIRSAIQSYAPLASGPKPPSLDKIWSQKETTKGSPIPLTKNTENKASSRSWISYMLAASLVFFVASMGINLYLFQENSRLQNRVEVLESNDSYLAQQYQVSKNIPLVVENRQAFLENEQHIRVPLNGLEADPDFKAMVFMNPDSREVFIHIENLPEPPEGHQYQLWAIVEGVSLDAGIFDFHSEIQRLRPMDLDVQAFAVTLEETGGSPLPNLDRMYVIGEMPVG